MKKILNISDIEIDINDAENESNINVQYISGKGYYIISEEEDGSVMADFPAVIGIVTENNEMDDNDVLFCPISYIGDHSVDLYKGKTLYETCSLSRFERLLDGHFRCDGETTAEDLIYQFEAHGVKLHPAIYRKYNINNN